MTRKQHRRRLIRQEEQRRRDAACHTRKPYVDNTHRASLPLSLEIAILNPTQGINFEPLKAEFHKYIAASDNYQSPLDRLVSLQTNRNTQLRYFIIGTWRERMAEKTPALARHFEEATARRWRALEAAKNLPYLDLTLTVTK